MLRFIQQTPKVGSSLRCFRLTTLASPSTSALTAGVVQAEEYAALLVFNPERMGDLHVGAKCLDEVIKNQVQAIEDAERVKRQSIANEKAAKTKVGRSEAGHRCGKPLFFALLG